MKVNVRGLSDGSQRRTRSAYPIKEAPKHLSQLGDMLIFCKEPVWNLENTRDLESKYKTWLQDKKDHTENRRDCARQHFGIIHGNVIGLTIHRCCRAVESIALRKSIICDSVNGSSKQFFEELNRSWMARKASHENKEIKFDERGADQFCLNGSQIIKECKFPHKLTESLDLLLKSEGEFLQTLLHPPLNLTRQQYEILSRINFGFQLVLVFGTTQITAVQKQLTACQGYYVQKALTDGELVGKKLTIRNFTDSVMETKHEESKMRKFLV